MHRLISAIEIVREHKRKEQCYQVPNYIAFPFSDAHERKSKFRVHEGPFSFDWKDYVAFQIVDHVENETCSPLQNNFETQNFQNTGLENGPNLRERDKIQICPSEVKTLRIANEREMPKKHVERALRACLLYKKAFALTLVVTDSKTMNHVKVHGAFSSVFNAYTRV